MDWSKPKQQNLLLHLELFIVQGILINLKTKTLQLELYAQKVTETYTARCHNQEFHKRYKNKEISELGLTLWNTTFDNTITRTRRIEKQM